ncbi:MAG: prepilin-type N-terminal cleavage/methylation domain-containing protein [Elusimicrobiaceae bacterium]|nr:prepilin-type N-terminal cleavage/methylation domain-containing protein [Elusimicrobiaceae bacterium]
MQKNNTGFTLIELLVVVLIIGILVAVALPQYQIAVKKATLSKYMGLVSSLKEAEEIYYLSNGEYTYNLDDLDTEFPFASHCVRTNQSQIDCAEMRVMIGKGNVQAGDQTIRYVQFFSDPSDTATLYGIFHKGDIGCYARGNIAITACRNLGGIETEKAASGWDKAFIIN